MSIPEISIIVPVYNTEVYLPRCVSSILAQTFTDWELLLIDDGSSDGSADICDGYACADLRIKVVHNENRGVSASRNTGIAMASGRWLAFIDSDDDIDPDYLKLLHSAADGHDLIAAGFKEISRDSSARNVYEPQILEKANIESYFTLPGWGFVWGRLFNADKIRDINLVFDKDITFREDNLFIENLLLHASSIALVEGSPYNYHTGITVVKSHIKSFEKELYALDRAKEIAARFNNTDIYKHLNIYGFLYHAILAVYKTGAPRSQRLKMLGMLDFDSRTIIHTPTCAKESVLYLLMRRKMWRLFDLLFSKTQK